MNFKEIVQNDIKNTFMNASEFADIHTVDDKPMTVIIDDYENIEREKKYKQQTDGLYKRQLLIYIRKDEYGKLPAFNTPLKLDGKIYRVVDAVDEDGLYSLTLEANKS